MSISFDSILIKTGQFGYFQKQILYSISLLQILLALTNFSFVFLGAKYPFSCTLQNGTVINDQCLSNCHNYSARSQYTSYAIDWGIVCNQNILSNIQVAHMIGLFIGAIIAGNLADRFGRLPILYISTFFISFINFLTIFAKGPYYYAFLTCLAGIFGQGAGLMSYTLILELVGPDYRAFCGIFEQIVYALGIALLALLAYLIPIWQNLSIVIFIFGPPALIIMIPFQIESIRWLASQQKSQKIIRELRYMLKVNSQDPTLVEEWLDQEINESYHQDEALFKNRTKREHIFLLFKNKATLKYLVVFCIAFFVNTGCYYGSTIEAGEAFSNPYLGFALSGLIEIPAHSLSPYLINKFGRRYFHSILMILSGIFFLLVWFMTNENWIYFLFTAAKLCCSMSFASAYIYASELFPTSVLSAALGFCITFGRFGAVISPLVLPLGRSIASVIFGISILFGGFQALLLRETLKRPIPLTMEEF